MPNRPSVVQSLSRRYFCGCVPVSVGSFLSSAILAILSIAMVIGIIILLADKKDIALSALPHDIKIGLAVLLVIFILVSLVSLLGLIGTVQKNRRLIRIYSWMVLGITAIQVAGEAYLIFTLFVRKCESGLEFQCISVAAGVKVLLLIVSLLLLAIQIYVAFTIRSYEKQLKEEEQLHQEYMIYNGGAFGLPTVGNGNGGGEYAKVPLNDDF